MPPAPAYSHADIAAAIARALPNANDRPDPLADADRSPLKYAGLSHDFGSGAWRHPDDADLPQASNKTWGLMAETIKAISAEYGGIIHKHISLMEVVTQLCQLIAAAGDAPTARQISNAFSTARDRHTNFYENELSEYIIIQGLMECEEASPRLYTLFWPAGAGAATTAGAAAA